MDNRVSKHVLLDGALATNLFEMGMPKDCCIPKWILENKNKVINLQKYFIKSGSDIIYTPTFNCSTVGLKKYGMENAVDIINRSLVYISKQACEGTSTKIAGCMSSTGLMLQPFGESSFTEVLQIFREQAEILVESGVDILVVETLTSITEARVAAIALQKFNIPVYITMTVNEDGVIPFGGSPVNALVILQELGISAFGLNCSYGPKSMVKCIKDMKNYSKIPIIAKPSACKYDKEKNELTQLSYIDMATQIRDIVLSGADIIGGCCQTTPKHLECISMFLKDIETTNYETLEIKGDITLADSSQIYNLYCDNIEFSDKLECSIDMTDDIISLEDNSNDVILVQIDSVDDAMDFSKNSHIAKLPICFSSHDEIALKLALMLYNGRAMIDSNSSIDANILEKIAKKYGAVIY